MSFLLLLLACSTEPAAPPLAPITDAEVGAAVAEILCQAATPAGIPCTVEGAVATVAGHRLEVQASVGSFVSLAPRSLGVGANAEVIPGEVQLGATVTLTVDDRPLLSRDLSTAGSDADLGVARGKALDELAGRWGVTVGVAVLDALHGDPAAPALGALGMKVPAQPLGALHGWAAYPLVRGQGFDARIAQKMAPSVQSMLAVAGPFVQDLPAEGVHTLEIEARLGGSGAPGPCGILPPVAMSPGATSSIVPLAGRVLVDGQPTGDICTFSESTKWPLPSGGAVLEWDQLVVLAPVPVSAAE